MQLTIPGLIVSVLLTIATVWSASAKADEPVNRDPWEGFNRAVFSFNDTLDFYLLKPAATGYDKITPDPLQSGISNFFSNLGEIRTIANSLFQLKLSQAGLDTTRFIVNSTVGLFGFIDIGSRIGLDKHEEDFGQTLGYWGTPAGPYLVLPLLGPSTLRDFGGRVPDYYLAPTREIDDDPTQYGVQALGVLDTRASLLQLEDLVAGDRYTFFRDAYLQRRDFLVNDGQLKDDFLDDDDLFEDFDDLEDGKEGEGSGTSGF